MTDLDGRVIAIAGAGGGLGPVVAKRLANAGATLALADRTEEHAAASKEQLGLPDERVDARAVDLLDESAANDWVAALTDRFGRVDGLLHLIGGYRGGEPIQSFDLADYEFLHNLLVRTLQLTTRAFHSALTESEHGRFLFVSATAAQNPEDTNAAYASAKTRSPAAAPQPTSSSSTRSRRRRCGRRTPKPSAPPSPQRRTSPRRSPSSARTPHAG